MTLNIDGIHIKISSTWRNQITSCPRYIIPCIPYYRQSTINVTDILVVWASQTRGIMSEKYWQDIVHIALKTGKELIFTLPGQSSMQYFIRRHSTGFYLLPFKGKSRDFPFLVAILQASSVLPTINSELSSSRGAGSRCDEQHEKNYMKKKKSTRSLCIF